MDIKRAWHSFRLYTIFSSKKRGDYVRRNKLFKHCGEDVRLPQMILPLYSNLISVGNNVELASGVKLVTHDAIYSMLNSKFNTTSFKENIGCISIGNNVFIGTNSIILPNISIGNNVIVGACSLVNKNLPNDGVYVGAPAKLMSSFDDFLNKRYLSKIVPHK